MTGGRTLADAVTALAAPPPTGKGATSDLSIDQVLLLHGAGWEPVDVVFGSCWWSVPWGSWQFQTGEVQAASSAFARAFAQAARALLDECRRTGGTGVVGVTAEVVPTGLHVDVALTGTAIRPRQGGHPAAGDGAFLSDLSARDFVLLARAGWAPLGVVAGASFVAAQRRGVGQFLSQQTQNTELPQLTQALYQAREGAMERMQRMATTLAADGVVGVTVQEGPVRHDRRFIGFRAMGTAVKLVADAHQPVTPRLAVSLDDRVRQFAAENLRG